MDKIWLKSYPPGVPAQIDLTHGASLNDVLAQSCRRYASLPAFSNMGSSMTYAELDRRSRDFAAYLQMQSDLARGDRVALMMPNLLQYPVALFGVLRAGMAVVNVNPFYTGPELEHQLTDSGAKAIVVLENFAHTVQSVLARTEVRHVIATGVGDLLAFPASLVVNLAVKYLKRMVPPFHIEGAIGFTDALARGAGQPLREVSVKPDDVAFLQYTGGTTGTPKGAVLTHGNMVANLEQTVAWIGRNLREGAEIVVTPLPLYHVFSLTANLLTFLRLGAHNVLITDPRDIGAVVKQLKRVAFTAITGVNTLFNALLNAPGVKEINARALKVAVGGGMAVQRAVAERWQQMFGVPLIEGYGLTEASPIVCANPLDATEYEGGIGLPLPSTEVSIRNDAGDELPPGEIGEICVRGPQVMKGYWNKPEETSKVFTADGWLRTGDLGSIDQRGYVKLVDRKKDMIVVSGFKIFPNEIEDVAMLHPGVLEAAAVGMPDTRTGEAVRLIARRKDSELTADELIAHCRGHLTSYKVPKSVSFRSTPLPKTTVGKILRRQIRDEETHAAA